MWLALKKGHSTADISSYFRTKTKRKAGNHFYGNKKNDKEYQAILKKIVCIEKDMKYGRFNDILNANKDSMNSNAKKMHAAELRIKTMKP